MLLLPVLCSDTIYIGRYLVCGSDSASLYLEVLSVNDQDILCEAKNGAVMDGLMTVSVVGLGSHCVWCSSSLQRAAWWQVGCNATQRYAAAQSRRSTASILCLTRLAVRGLAGDQVHRLRCQHKSRLESTVGQHPLLAYLRQPCRRGGGKQRPSCAASV